MSENDTVIENSTIVGLQSELLGTLYGALGQGNMFWPRGNIFLPTDCVTSKSTTFDARPDGYCR